MIIKWDLLIQDHPIQLKIHKDSDLIIKIHDMKLKHTASMFLSLTCSPKLYLFILIHLLFFSLYPRNESSKNFNAQNGYQKWNLISLPKKCALNSQF